MTDTSAVDRVPGLILRDMRERRGLTRDDLSVRAGVSVSAIAVVELQTSPNARGWTPKNARRVAQALHAAAPLSAQELEDFGRITRVSPGALLGATEPLQRALVHAAAGPVPPAPSAYELFAARESFERLVARAGPSYVRGVLDALLVSATLSVPITSVMPARAEAPPSAPSSPAQPAQSGTGPQALVSDEVIGGHRVRRYDPINPKAPKKRRTG